MTPDQFLAAFDDEHERFLAACARAGMSAPVPSCPGWTVADLCYHLYEVQDAWHHVVAEQRQGFEGITMPARVDDAQLPEVTAAEHAAYSGLLASLDPAAPQWTWKGTFDVGWLIRRMAHETLIHRVDAERAVPGDTLTPIDPALASDGVDEFLHVFLNRRNGTFGGSVHLHCTDVDGEWTVRESDDAVVVTREHAKGDCAIRGAAVDILLALWRRGPLDACDVVGDASVAARFVQASRLE